MTSKKLKEIVLVAALEETKGHRRRDGRNDWIVKKVRRSAKDGSGWYWVWYHAPPDELSEFAALFGGGPTCLKMLTYLGDDVAKAESES